MIRRLASAIGIAVLASQIAAALAWAQADAPAPSQSIDEELVLPTALDGVGITTAPVTKGIVVRLGSGTILPGRSLRVDYSLGSLAEYQTVSKLAEAHAQESFNWRNIAIFGEAAPLERDGSITDELGNWRVGVKWALHDETSLFRPVAVRALMAAGARDLEAILHQDESDALREEREQLWQQMRDRTETTLEQAFTWECYGTDPFADATKQNWKWELPESLSRSLDKARAECKAKNSSAIAEARRAVLDGMLAAVEEWVDTLPCPTAKGVAVKFQVLERDRDRWQDTWKRICTPRIERALADAAALRKAKERLSGGLVLSAEASLVGAALAGMEGDGNPTTARDYYGNLTFQLGYRYFWERTALDLAFFPIRDVIDLDRADALPAYALAANLEFGRGQLWGSSVIVSLDAEADRFARDTTDREYKLEQRIAIPLPEKTFLHLGLREVYARGQGWDTSISLALAWSFEQDGKELARRIELLKQQE